MISARPAALLALLAASFELTAAAQDLSSSYLGPIKEIEVRGNTKTKAHTVLLIAGIDVDDAFSPEIARQVEADLVDSGLFKEVDISWVPVDGGLKVTILARDKHSWVVAPTYYNQPTNKGGGIGFGENNLLGENKKLLLYGQYATGDTFFIGAYLDPSIRGSRFRWQIDTYLLSGRVIEYKPPGAYMDQPKEVRTTRLHYLNAGVRAGVTLLRGGTLDMRLRGAKVFYIDTALADGAVMSDVTDDPMATQVPDPGREGYDVSAELLLEYDHRANWYGVTHGDRFRFTFEYALPHLASDFEYWYTSFHYERARRFFSRHNLVVRSSLSYGHDMPFQQEYTAGGTNLRGFKNSQYRGNLKASGTVEYSLPVAAVRGVSLRLVGFLDTSYIAFVDDAPGTRNYLPGHGRLGLAPFKNTVGLGTRLYIRQLVLPLLGLDVGYGLERRDFEVYLAIGLTDS